MSDKEDSSFLIEYFLLHSGSFDSRDGLQNSTSSIAEESDEERKLREAKANIQKSLRVYAQKHKETFDFTEMEKSLQHCDRSGTRLMHENEVFYHVVNGGGVGYFEFRCVTIK